MRAELKEKGYEPPYCDVCSNREFNTLTDVEYEEAFPETMGLSESQYVLCEKCLQELREDKDVTIMKEELIFFDGTQALGCSG